MLRFSWVSSRRSLRVAAAASASLATVLAFSASVASASTGYELDSVKTSLALGAQVAHGLAFDQASQALYVTELTTDLENESPGQIEQFDASGVPTANSPFTTGGTDFFASVAVNPVTHEIYAYQLQVSTPNGTKGTSQINVFSS